MQGKFNCSKNSYVIKVAQEFKPQNVHFLFATFIIALILHLTLFLYSSILLCRLFSSFFAVLFIFFIIIFLLLSSLLSSSPFSNPHALKPLLSSFPGDCLPCLLSLSLPIFPIFFYSNSPKSFSSHRHQLLQCRGTLVSIFRPSHGQKKKKGFFKISMLLCECWKQ